MDITEQRIAIAEACGWQWWKHTKSITYIFGHPSRTKETLDDAQMQWEKVANPWPVEPRHQFVYLSGVPDYLNSFDAIREATKTLGTTGKLHDFVYHLSTILSRDNNCITMLEAGNSNALDHWAIGLLNATVGQLAEAFLKTIGKWKTE